MTTQQPASDGIDDFVRRFADFWRAPSPDRMSEVLAQDVVLVQPMSARMQGLAAAQREFAGLFSLLPDLRADVERWSGRDETLFIEIRLHATLSGRPVEWRAVDRFQLRGDLAVERVSYFNAAPLLLRLLQAPASWLRLLRMLRLGSARPLS